MFIIRVQIPLSPPIKPLKSLRFKGFDFIWGAFRVHFFLILFFDLEREINSFYGKYAAKEDITIAEAKKRVSKLDIEAYERKAKKYVKDKNLSKQANEEMRLYNLTMKINRLEMLKSRIGLELISGFDDLEKFMADILKGRTQDELERQAGILGDSVTESANFGKKVDSIVNASFHNATFSQRIWAHQDLLKLELDKQLKQGLIQGKGARDLARNIRDACNASMRNAERLMITELARVQIEAQKLSYKENGFEMYEFISEPTACPICKDLDGKHFEVEKMMPGENAAPMHPYCRCSTAPYSDRKEFDEWMNRLGEGETTEEWGGGKGIEIASPGSSKSFKTSLRSIMKGKAGLDKRRKRVLDLIPNSGDYHRFKRDAISIRDLAYLSAATGVEFALFRSKNEDILVRGTNRNCNVVGELGDEILGKRYEWVAHSHVDMGNLSPSTADKKTLRLLGQKESKLIGVDGMESKFDDSLF